MFAQFKEQFEGELYFNESPSHEAIKNVYATDASVYQEKPLAVAIPKGINDIQKLIRLAKEHKFTLIPRAAGTSLAGQVVGPGVMVDISKNLNKIIELNVEEQWVRVQPGVIRDDLNAYLKPFGLMFGPETSTSSRAMIGGMIGNNSSGLHSIIWGDTRNNLLEIKAFLSDGAEVIINTTDQKGKGFLNEIRKNLHEILDDESLRTLIGDNSPKASITRRNTGYALDLLLKDSDNLLPLIAGSEGTLCFVTEARLKLLKLPPAHVGMVAVHCTTLDESLKSNLVALAHQCSASELVDDYILRFTKINTEQSKNRFFIEGEPKAILMVEFFDENPDSLTLKLRDFIDALKVKGLGYAYPMLYAEDTKKAWELRKAGLGLLRNLPGDSQPVNLIEDCAVDANDLPDYIRDLEVLLKSHGLEYSMYAHAGAGELHVEPMINLKSADGVQLFRKVLSDTAQLVKKYKGSLSGEHGDGRLRGEFIPDMVGEEVYQLFRKVKHIFDPEGVFNKGKITDTPSMIESLRYKQEPVKQLKPTVFDFSHQENMLRLSEKCSGSGDCRKTEITGGTMCPSYMATRSEKDTTRARANILRQYMTEPEAMKNGQYEVKEILDLCLSCKACKSECPSGVDISKMKAEFTQQYYDEHGVPFRSRLIADFTSQMKLAAIFPPAYNFIFGNSFLRSNINKIVGFHPERTMPLLGKQTLLSWFKSRKDKALVSEKKVLLFCDEFTNYNDTEVGEKTVLLLEKLGYQVIIPDHIESGRTYLSKGLIRKAKAIVEQNILKLKDLVTEETPMIGIEPSAILTFRDEYLDLAPAGMKADAEKLSGNIFMFDEWFVKEIEKGNIKKESFTSEKASIRLHGHCQQKALGSLVPAKKALSFPEGYQVQLIPSGCCGMAGSFGYEKEHYEVSMKIGELVLFPAVRKEADDVIIAAPGTSCRHQIKDGTGEVAQHPIEILYDALKK
jgi:FAD/FMN-containing dehydrogenase/Fe-S oxidoreductase